MGKERDDDDVDMPNAGGDGVRAVQERDAAQRAHGHGYSWTLDTHIMHGQTNLCIILLSDVCCSKFQSFDIEDYFLLQYDWSLRNNLSDGF